MGLFQMFLYCWMLFDSSSSWTFYFDPRIGLFLVETALNGSEPMNAGWIRWGSVVVVIALGILMLLGSQRLGTYLILESILSTPSLFFFATVLAANVGPTHGFSIGELLVPVVVFAVFSGFPAFSVLRLLKARGDEAVAP
jgi:hypothetical protein